MLESFEKKGVKEVKYISLRGEPIIYIKGVAYCLRDYHFPLKPISYYKNISQQNIELMEERLKEDIISEISSSSNHLLLHREIYDKCKIENFVELVEKDDVKTFSQLVKEIQKEKENHLKIDFKRIPIPPTANKEGFFFLLFFYFFYFFYYFFYYFFFFLFFLLFFFFFIIYLTFFLSFFLLFISYFHKSEIYYDEIYKIYRESNGTPILFNCSRFHNFFFYSLFYDFLKNK